MHTSLQNGWVDCFSSNAVHDMRQEPISTMMMRFPFIKLKPEPTSQVWYKNCFSVIGKLRRSVHLSKDVLQNHWERLLLKIIFVFEKVLNEGLIVREKAESCCHEAILCLIIQSKDAINLPEINNLLLFGFGHLGANDLVDFSIVLDILIIMHEFKRVLLAEPSFLLLDFTDCHTWLGVSFHL